MSALYDTRTEKLVACTNGAVLEIVFNNPERHNALSVEMWSAIPALLKQAEADSAVRLILFRGSGTRAFVSGADISQFKDHRATKEAVDRYEVMAENGLQSILNCDKPTIAAIRGYCFGAGVNIAASCDIRLAARTATFCVPAAKLGLGYRLTAMQNLIHLIGVAATKDLFYTARRVTTPIAHQFGLVTAWAEDEAFDPLVQTYCDQISENAPLTIRTAKRIARELTKAPDGADLQGARGWIRECFESRDYTEGRTAFMEKRKPVFTGR